MTERLHIVGADAVGSLVAAGAQKHGVPYARYPRNPETAPQEAQWIDGTKYQLEPCSSHKPELSENDVLLFPLKVYQLEAALSSWLAYLEARPTIVLMHNGLGGFELARELLPENYPLLLATTSHGALKRVDKSNKPYVVYTYVGSTQIGISPQTSKEGFQTHKDGRVARAISVLHKALPDVIIADEIMKALWTKLAVNAVINPLTALNDIPNRCILEDQFSYLRHAVCEEFINVAKACGYTFSLKDVLHTVAKVAKATGRNYSSMHQDVANKRQTEIAAINGYIVEMAKKKGINVPVNALLVEKINAL
ncbi:ketopantoate reductase family protein [Alteromonas gracilis]|uniref:ketopantoate reductase family protein n=1 Tax=Alteromonas gracilis TaxID=1479524 RepID=UPI00321B2D3E